MKVDKEVSTSLSGAEGTTNLYRRVCPLPPRPPIEARLRCIQLWGWSRAISRFPHWCREANCICIQDPYSERKGVLATGKKSPLPDLWSQKVSDISVWQKVYVGHGP